MKHRLLKYQKVSFDIYDTLIKRDVERPEDIFSFLAREYVNQYKDGKRALREIVEMRLMAQKDAERNKKNEEISLEEIYENSIFDKREREFLLKTEMDLEYDLAQRNLQVGVLYDWCVFCGKQVLIVSDMYLPIDWMKRILEKNGYGNFRGLYLSSDVRKRKSTGSLFGEMLKREGCAGKEIMHIGDAWRGDFIKPLLKKMAVMHMPKNINYSEYRVSGAHSMTDAFINNRACLLHDFYERFGYECMGQVLAGFSIWLQGKIFHEANDEVFFLSREGQLLQKAYEILFPQSKSKYLYVSGKSLRTLLFCGCNSLEEMLESIRFPHYFHVKEVFDLLGLKGDEKIFRLCGNEAFSKWQDIKKDVFLWDYLQKKETYIKEHPRDQRRLFEKLLEMNQKTMKIALVDIGWRGSMQECLEKYFETMGKGVDIQGYYLGVSRDAKNWQNKKGYLFNGGDGGRDFVDEDGVFGFGGLMESLFTADHGSVKEYEMTGSRIEPVLYGYECPSGEIQRIQEGALRFVRDIRESPLLRYAEWEKPKLIFAKMQRVGNVPRRKELDLLGKIAFFDAGKAEKVIEEIKQPFCIKQCFASLYNAGWKIGFLKKRFPLLPVATVYKFWRRRKG